MAGALLNVRGMLKPLSLCLVTACAIPSSTDNAPPTSIAWGTYHMRTTIDLTAEAALPEPADQLVVTLHDFSVHPGHTLLDLADQAGVPAVDTLRAALPDVVESQLEGWIDDEIAKLQLAGVPITQLAGSAATLAESTLTQVELDSELAAGRGATHRLVALDFAPAGIAARFDLSSGPSDLVIATTSTTASGSTLHVGDHAFGLPFGDYAWQAAEQAFATSYGVDFRGALGAAIDCSSLASTIASKCVFGVCVGHQVELDAICERGLDEVVDQARAQVASLDWTALHYRAGSATLVDDDHDGVAEALAGGVWTTELDVGVGPRPVPATFIGSR